MVNPFSPKKRQTVRLEWDVGFRQINECEHLFVRQLREIEELTLEVTVEEAKAQAPILVPPYDTQVGRLLVGTKPILPDESCRVFRLVFDRNRMVSYSVLNESFGKYPEPPDEFVGKRLRAFSRSRLLEFTKLDTIASDEYPGALKHYQIVCENHVIDVICTEPPTIEVGGFRA